MNIYQGVKKCEKFYLKKIIILSKYPDVLNSQPLFNRKITS